MINQFFYKLLLRPFERKIELLSKTEKIQGKKRITSKQRKPKCFLWKTNCVNVVSKVILRESGSHQQDQCMILNQDKISNRARLAREYRTLEQGCFDYTNHMVVESTRADRTYEITFFKEANNCSPEEQEQNKTKITASGHALHSE